MRSLTFLTGLIFLIIQNSCTMKDTSTDTLLSPDTTANHDPHSYARPREAVVRHLHMDINLDFEKKIISGTAELDFVHATGVKEIVLDTRDLLIEVVTLENGEVAPFKMGDADQFLGRSLSIQFPAGTKRIRIKYSTSPQAAALQWLNPEQTAGKSAPFLFTQSQAILARTWVPIQDSPGIRFTYSANVQAPKGLMVIMSAENPEKKSSDGKYTFNMPQPIPAYLLALAAGDFNFQAIDSRSGVYAEAVSMDAALYEFAELPNMISAAEKLYGPYEWGRFDLIVLPPSFPFGGMENPRITFATPTILAGDRSLTSLVAHELAHSWSGNLVTNANWNDFWLNEGFTVYFENRIMESLYGKDFADMQRLLGQQDLHETAMDLGMESPDTKLKLDLKGRDPDDGMNDIAYEKGCNLLMLVEAHIGRTRWDEFLKGYFKRHAFRTMNTEAFLQELKNTLFASDEAGWNSIGVEKWVYQAGIPDNILKIDSRFFDEADQQAKDWLKGKAANQLTTKDFNTFQWLRFFQGLTLPLTEKQVSELDNTFHFSKSGNSEILFAWLEICIRSNYWKNKDILESFLVKVGRRKFVKPLFKAMMKTAKGKTIAADIYKKARPNYHSVTQQTIDNILANN